MMVVALSGGKDSTAMALRMAELGEEVSHYLITPTGDELPSMTAHWALLEGRLGMPLTRVTEHTLDSLIQQWDALPNWRQRWCTRMLKIRPCLDWIQMQPGRVTLCVGLRADEPERKGIYSEDVDTRFPLREWGWGIADVKSYLHDQGIEVPARTDCARCYAQKLVEWYELWKDHPRVYADAEAQESRIGHTFRSPQRDSWPAALADVRELFEQGHVPRDTRKKYRPPQLNIWGQEETDDEGGCRVCRI